MAPQGSWRCDGVPRNGKQYPNSIGAHPLQDNTGSSCNICGLPREAMSQRLKLNLPTVAIAIVALAAVVAGGLLLRRSNPCPQGEEMKDGVCVVILPNGPFPNQTSEKFSSGDRVIFTHEGILERDQGVEEFRAEKYSEAIESFEKAVTNKPNHPEPQIYLNNAKARQQGNPYLLAVVVPVDNRANQAKEILRGVADAQTKFNDSGGASDRLLEIMIVNDGNDKEVAAAVAKQLVNNKQVLGVIGHNSSEASQSALTEYEPGGLTMISPTSTSTLLEGKVFCRTVPSDRASAQKLARYAVNELNIGQVIVLYDSESIYSESLKREFTDYFGQKGGRMLQEFDLADSQLDAEAEIQKAQAEGVLLVPGTKTASAAVAVARAIAKQQLPLLGGDALYTMETIKEGAESIEGLVLAVPWFPQTPYAKEATSRWGGQVNWRTASSYDAAQAFITTLSDKVSRQDVLKKLASVDISPEETSGERLRFTANGDREGEPLLVQVVPSSGSTFQFKPLSE
ncbi:MAG: ABC transporter substrate-binding protein [Symploca sp. SIO2G7]|nr:ABC transporter substrate-binding protein [Symploca sp. SIO2G7]